MNQSLLPGEDVEAFYFGPNQSLFGIYHVPPPSLAREQAVVLVPSIEQEAIRGHRAYRQLAIRLTRLGFPTMRFDYWGTGDSKGEDTSAGMSQWSGDLMEAITEVRKRSQKQRVCLVGLRLGAALATIAAASTEIDGLVLWEPVINGEIYLEELTAWHQDKLWYFLSEAPALTVEAQPTELLGLPMSKTLFSDLMGVNLMAIKQAPARQVMIVEHEAEPSVDAFKTFLKQWDINVQHQVVADPRVWTDDPDKALVPNQILQVIVSWFSERLV